MASEDLSGIGEAIRKASEAYVEALTAVTRALTRLTAQAGGPERERMVEDWLRIARMSKDGVVGALEQGFELWEREVRRMAAGGSGGARKAANPIEAWAENWRKATETFAGSSALVAEARKQAEAVQEMLQQSLRAWQRLWEPPNKS
ncbi:MAG TPA: hypothetical protein VFB33_08835 [Candidatus Binataceae bacterium]|nr:hypothetical protein [Candidatus Binataceae bacterium]